MFIYKQCNVAINVQGFLFVAIPADNIFSSAYLELMWYVVKASHIILHDKKS